MYYHFHFIIQCIIFLDLMTMVPLITGSLLEIFAALLFPLSACFGTSARRLQDTTAFYFIRFLAQFIPHSLALSTQTIKVIKMLRLLRERLLRQCLDGGYQYHALNGTHYH